jgi:hypothetical protein
VAGVRAAKGDDQARGEEEGEGLEGAPGGGCEGVEGEWLGGVSLGGLVGIGGEGRGRTSEDAMAVRV